MMTGKTLAQDSAPAVKGGDHYESVRCQEWPDSFDHRGGQIELLIACHEDAAVESADEWLILLGEEIEQRARFQARG